MPIELESEVKSLRASLKETGDQLKTYAEEANKQIKRAGDMSAELKSEVDKLLTEKHGMAERIAAAEQRLAEMDQGGRGEPRAPTLGQFVTQSDEYKNSRDGFFNMAVSQFKANITSAPDSGGTLIQPQRQAGVVVAPERRLFVRDLIPASITSSNSIEYVREEGFTNAAAVVSENPSTNKPQSDITFELEAAPVVTIAHHIRASKQVLRDARMLASYIDGRLRYGLRLVEEAQFLKGSGVGLEINGIFTQASTYSNPGVTVTGETKIDRLRLAMLQVELAEYSADALVLNPIDWADIELTKDNEERYIFATPSGRVGPGLWGLPVVATRSLDAGEYLTGAFSLGAQIHDNEMMSVRAFEQDRDNVVRNLVTILAELRTALTVYRPEAFVKGEFGSL